MCGGIEYDFYFEIFDLFWMEINCIRILFCIDNFCVYVFIYIYCIVGMLYS